MSSLFKIGDKIISSNKNYGSPISYEAQILKDGGILSDDNRFAIIYETSFIKNYLSLLCTCDAYKEGDSSTEGKLYNITQI